MEFHEAANIFPMMEGSEFEALIEDIRKNGLHDEIYLFEGKIIDGRNRYKACKAAGVNPRMGNVKIDGAAFDPVAFVLSKNLHRRHLTPSQAGMIGARAREIYERQAKERMKAGKGSDGSGGRGNPSHNCDGGLDTGRASEKAGASVGVSRGTIERASRVLEKGIPELAKAVDAGRISVFKAADIATKPQEEQKKIVANPEQHRVERQQPTAAIANGNSNSKPHKEKQPDAELEPPQIRGVGVFRANEAVDALKRIPRNDPLRNRGFQIVTDWIRANK
jgi:ParB-like chromosome segregation protein Spo0J